MYYVCMAEIATAYYEWQGYQRFDAIFLSPRYYAAITHQEGG